MPAGLHRGAPLPFSCSPLLSPSPAGHICISCDITGDDINTLSLTWLRPRQLALVGGRPDRLPSLSNNTTASSANICDVGHVAMFKGLRLSAMAESLAMAIDGREHYEAALLRSRLGARIQLIPTLLRRPLGLIYRCEACIRPAFDMQSTAGAPPPSVLYNVIKTHNIDPRWDDIPLPTGQYRDRKGYLDVVLCQTATLSLSSEPDHGAAQDTKQTSGRSLNSCKTAFSQLSGPTSYPPPSRLGSQSGPQTPHTVPSTLKRQFQPEALFNVGGREIRPKPSPASRVYGQPSGSVSEPPAKRKRGRPTKAEQQAKRERETAAVMTAPPAQMRLETPALVTPISAGPFEETKPAVTPVSRISITSVLTPNQPKSASHSGSSGSSGKRRRGRPGSKRESETGAEAGGSGKLPMRQQTYGSPYRAPSSMDLDDETVPRSIIRRPYDEIRPGSPHRSSPMEGEHRDPRPPPPRLGPLTSEARPRLPPPPQE
nr:hypothetical protein CFP56_28658 [Quercus suber]